jgi:hypothetical protein
MKIKLWKIEHWLRNPIHRLICWYLRKCGGAAHCYKYGPKGRYFVLMDEKTYHDFNHKVEWRW